MFCQDPSAGPRRCTIASVSPEIGLIGVHKPQDWSIRVAEHMITHATRRLSLTPTAAKTQITAGFTMNELSDPEAMADGIRRWMAQTAVEGSTVPGDRLVAGTVTGTPGQLVTLSGLAKGSRLSTESPQTITFDQQEVAL